MAVRSSKSPAGPGKTAGGPPRRLGYARVSTDDQTLDSQLDALRTAGCDSIVEERASGGNRLRPELARLLARIMPGDTIVVTRLDRLARSLSHLLEILESLEAKGAFFRCLASPIETAGPQGRLMLQMLGAFAEFERSLIRERTVSGLDAARSRGRIGGNPGVRAGNRAAIAKITRSRDEGFLAELLATMDGWMPTVRTRRQAGATWEDIVAELNATPATGNWTSTRLTLAVRRLVKEGFVDAKLLVPAPSRGPRPASLFLVAAIVRANPRLTLAEIGTQLQEGKHRTPRGRAVWKPGSVKNLIDRARREGLLPSR